jgi:hypothetical protein
MVVIMQKYLNTEALETHLLHIKTLMDEYQNQGQHLYSNLLHWFHQIETILQNAQMVSVSEISILRGVLISAERGYFDPNYGVLPKGRSKRKALFSLSVILIRKAQEVINKELKPYIEDEKEARSLLKQIILVADSNHHLEFVKHFSNEQKENTAQIWAILEKDENIRQGFCQVKAKVSYPKALQILHQLLWEREGKSKIIV